MLSIITPVFGHSELTTQFINNLSPYLLDAELILIDNNSPDNTINVINVAKKSMPTKDIKLFSHNKNVGFGAANNIGASIASGDILLFISNDVVIVGDIVSPVIQYLNSNQNVVCGPHLISYDSGWNNFKETSVIPYVEGFCMAMHKSTFDMVGGFDDNIFLDFEDLDLCHRMFLAGVALSQINLPVIHQLGGSFDQLTTPRAEITAQSLNYIMRKWKLTR